MKTTGQLAYETYWEAAFQAYSKPISKLPLWDQEMLRIQKAWQAVADAVSEQAISGVQFFGGG